MELSHMDEFIDELLREERACDVILPRIQVIHLHCNIAENIIQLVNLYKFYCYLFRLYVPNSDHVTFSRQFAIDLL